MTQDERNRNNFVFEASVSFASILNDLIAEDHIIKHVETRTDRDKDKFHGLIIADVPDDEAFDYYARCVGKFDVNLQVFPTRVLVVFTRKD